jgi:hypothetical protein
VPFSVFSSGQPIRRSFLTDRVGVRSSPRAAICEALRALADCWAPVPGASLLKTSSCAWHVPWVGGETAVGPRRRQGRDMPSYEVNDAGVAKARELIDAGQYLLDSEWSAAQPDADTENAQLDRHGYDGYGQWHLGINTDAGQQTKERYGFVYGDFGRVHRSGLIAAKQRAAQNDHTDVEAAADDLLDRLDQVRADG